MIRLDLCFLLLDKEILGYKNHNSKKRISAYFIYFYFEQKQQYQSGQYKMQTGYKMQIGHKMQTVDCRL